MLGLGLRPATLASLSPAVIGPALPLTLPTKATFTTDAPAGTVIWAGANIPTGTTLAFSPNDGRVVGSGSNRLVVGLSAASAGTIAGTVTLTLPNGGASKPYPVTINVTQAITNAYATRPVITGTPMSSEVLTASIGNLGSGAGQWYRSGASTGVTAATYTLADADIGFTFTYRYTPSGGSMVESAPTDTVQQADFLTDASANRITDASGNTITLGYNYAYNAITDASGNVITDASGNPICTVSPAPVQQQVRLLAPFSPSSNTFNQNALTTAPITFAMSDADRYVRAASGVPWQVYAPNMSRVEVWAAGAAIATVIGSDAQGYFRGTLDLSAYANGPRWFEVRGYDKSTVGGSSAAIFAGVHLFLTGGTNTNKSQLPAAAQANGFALQFIDDFATLSVSGTSTNNGTATWYDGMPNNRVFGDQIFTRNASAQNPFANLGSFLRIRETYDANFAGGVSGQKHWYSGILASVFPDGTSNVPAANGYYEADILIPTGSGTWPAFWLLSQDTVTDTSRAYSSREIDMEQYNVLEQVTDTTHRYAAGTAADTSTFKRVAIPGIRWEFHRFGFNVSDTKIDYYLDDVLVFSDTNFVTSGPNPRNNMVLFDLALTPGGNNSPETPPPGSYYDMFVDSFRYYA